MVLVVVVQKGNSVALVAVEDMGMMTVLQRSLVFTAPGDLDRMAVVSTVMIEGRMGGGGGGGGEYVV